METRRKQKWETYHSYEAALRRKEQLDLIQQHENERAQYREGALAPFLEEYVELYGRIHWACSTYTSNEGLIRNYIVPFSGSMRLTEFSPKVIAALYGKLQSDPQITPSVLTNIHKLLHSNMCSFVGICAQEPFPESKCSESLSNRNPDADH